MRVQGCSVQEVKTIFLKFTSNFDGKKSFFHFFPHFYPSSAFSDPHSFPHPHFIPASAFFPICNLSPHRIFSTTLNPPICIFPSVFYPPIRIFPSTFYPPSAFSHPHFIPSSAFYPLIRILSPHPHFPICILCSIGIFPSAFSYPPFVFAIRICILSLPTVEGLKMYEDIQFQHCTKSIDVCNLSHFF